MNKVMDEASFSSDSPSRIVRSRFGPAPASHGEWLNYETLGAFHCNACRAARHAVHYHAVPYCVCTPLYCAKVAMLHDVLCCAVLCCAVLCCAVLCCAVLCRVLCGALPEPCCARLNSAVSCRVVLCCAVLCCAVTSHLMLRLLVLYTQMQSLSFTILCFCHKVRQCCVG